jgi:hypothetical protein
MMKWFVGLVLLLGSFAYAVIQHDALLRWQMARVQQQEGPSTGDDFLRLKYAGDPRPYLGRFSDGLAWRHRLCGWAFVLGDYPFVVETAGPAVEAHKEGPLANSEDMQQLMWLNAQALEMVGRYNDAKAAYHLLLDLHPDFVDKDVAQQRMTGLELYH